MSGNRASRRAADRAPALEDRYGDRRERRALLPAIVAAGVLLGGLLLVGQEGYLLIRFAAAVLALIVAVFVWQAKAWALLPAPIVIAVLWNPVLPFAFSGQAFRLGHVVAAATVLLTGFLARSAPR